MQFNNVRSYTFHPFEKKIWQTNNRSLLHIQQPFNLIPFHFSILTALSIYFHHPLVQACFLLLTAYNVTQISKLYGMYMNPKVVK